MKLVDIALDQGQQTLLFPFVEGNTRILGLQPDTHRLIRLRLHLDQECLASQGMRFVTAPKPVEPTLFLASLWTLETDLINARAAVAIGNYKGGLFQCTTQ